MRPTSCLRMSEVKQYETMKQYVHAESEQLMSRMLENPLEHVGAVVALCFHQKLSLDSL